MYRTLALIVIIFLSTMLFISNALAGEAPPEFGFLDVSLEIDPSVRDFRGNVSIVLKDAASGQQYQYVFRQNQNYVLPDNPIKVIVSTYDVETYVHSAAGASASGGEDASVAGADGEPVRQITVPASGATLALRAVNNAAGEIQETVPQAGGADLNSLIPVMDRFYENTAYAVNGDMVKRLEIWTSGSTRERFLRDPNHTQEQWDSLTLYERANYYALTIIPFDMLFTYNNVEINLNDKTSFTAPLLRNIDYLRSASTDGGTYYGEVCKVIDWIWDYYVQNRDFVNVIDEYAKLKADEPANTETANEGINTAGNERAPQASAPPDDIVETPDGKTAPAFADTTEKTLAGTTEKTLAGSFAKNDNETPVRNNPNENKSQVKLLEKLKANVFPIFTGAGLVLIFLGLRKLNKDRMFQSEEKSDWEN